MTVNEARLRATTDAAVWASEFMGLVESGVTVDFGLMVGWFANAIETAKVLGDDADVVRAGRNRDYGSPQPLRDAIRDVIWNYHGAEPGEEWTVLADEIVAAIGFASGGRAAKKRCRCDCHEATPATDAALRLPVLDGPCYVAEQMMRDTR